MPRDRGLSWESVMLQGEGEKLQAKDITKGQLPGSWREQQDWRC
jgi:hypothetical protein